MKCILYIFFIEISLHLASATSNKEICETCAPAAKCPLFRKMNNRQQQTWLENFQCQKPYDYYNNGPPTRFETTTTEVFVCCSNKIWGFESNNNQNSYINNNPRNYNENNNQRLPEPIVSENQNYNNANVRTNPVYNVNNANGSEQAQKQNSQTSFHLNNIMNTGQNRPDNNFNNQGLNIQYPFTNNPNIVTTPNPYFAIAYGRGNSSKGTILDGSCKTLTSFPPAPETGCCGREASDADRITDSQNAPPSLQSALNFNVFNKPIRTARATPEEKVNITLENRITGGSETELYQFPWTVLLATTFDYGTYTAVFHCGGSLLSSRYVLTAGHCMYEKGGIVKSVKVYLAEYDKRTFPRDCKVSMGKTICIENVVMDAEQVIQHPQYIDDTLSNDIALIRLRGNAPYTDYIRPICLPSFNIDDPDFFNLRLAVAGWGRNGPYQSDIKQSTIVNLVPQDECRRFYRSISTRQLCAAGYSGEDTCNGDSGGPLMILYRGRFYVVGIVSGKRADSPCGTSVPSLYTNVYHYLDWIKSSIRK